MEASVNTIVYIDGFNLCYAIRSTGCRWLNLKALVDAVLPSDNNVIKIKYYTARVSGAADPDQPRQQQIYLNAMKTVPEIEIFYGKFLAKTVWCPLMNLPAADRAIITGQKDVCFPVGTYPIQADQNLPQCKNEILSIGSYSNSTKNVIVPKRDAIKAQVHWMEEKGSDVNLACHLVNDAWACRFDTAAVLSNDTDLVEPIRIVTQELKKSVILLCPSRHGASQPLRSVSSSVRHIRYSHLKSSLFTDSISTQENTIQKPPSW